MKVDSVVGSSTMLCSPIYQTKSRCSSLEHRHWGHIIGDDTNFDSRYLSYDAMKREVKREAKVKREVKKNNKKSTKRV